MSARRPRAAIYNKFWKSQGGGERHSGMVAQVLAELGADVDLIGHDKVDKDNLADHLGLDLSACRMRIVPDEGEAAVTVLSADYDLLVNGSYMSSVRSRARRSAYLCYFPTPEGHDLPRWRQQVIRVLGPYVRHPTVIRYEWGTGWFPSEGGRRRQWQWTSGDASVTFSPGLPIEARFDLGRPGTDAHTEVEISCNGGLLATLNATATFTRYSVLIPESDDPRTIRFRSATFAPPPPDTRQLGAALSRIRLRSPDFPLRSQLAMRYPWLLRDPRNVGFIDSYDVIFANSKYTRGWIHKSWNHEAEVLYPPIQVERFRPAATRDRTIVTAGRFFAPGHGHSKRQLEQVAAFRQLVDRGLAGWTLHMIGGCEPRSEAYLNTVRRAAAGLPVEIHANAPRHVVEKLMSSASIVWSATGLGEDDRKSPWTSEHFGMTTAEAMSGGCVPVVIDKAGQREIVRDGIDGFRWVTIDELQDRTMRIVTDDQLRARLAANAVERAQLYSDAAFATRLRELVTTYDLF